MLAWADFYVTDLSPFTQSRKLWMTFRDILVQCSLIPMDQKVVILLTGG